MRLKFSSRSFIFYHDHHLNVKCTLSAANTSNYVFCLNFFFIEMLIIVLCCRFQIGLDQYIKIEDT